MADISEYAPSWGRAFRWRAGSGYTPAAAPPTPKASMITNVFRIPRFRVLVDKFRETDPVCLIGNAGETVQEICRRAMAWTKTASQTAGAPKIRFMIDETPRRAVYCRLVVRKD